MAGHVKVANEKTRKRLRRKVHIRLRITGTAERPRLSVFRSARYVYAQAVDDTTGRVLAAASELESAVKPAIAGKTKKERAPRGRDERREDALGESRDGVVVLRH